MSTSSGIKAGRLAVQHQSNNHHTTLVTSHVNLQAEQAKLNGTVVNLQEEVAKNYDEVTSPLQDLINSKNNTIPQ